MTNTKTDLKTRLKNANSLLMITHGSKIHHAVIDILKIVIKEGSRGVYISINKPHKTIDENLTHEKINTKNIFYIDCITALAHHVPHERGGRVLYADHPSDLTTRGVVPMAINQFVLSVPGKKFILIDALRTLFLYNEPDVVARFVGLLIEKYAKLNTKIIVLTRAEDETTLIDDISYLFDEVLELEYD